MRVQNLLEQWFLKAADQIVARRRPPPLIRQLAEARIVAHRGGYDNRRVFENTMAAFERFQHAGGWGIELDIHWSREGVPVVSHDPDGRRLFGVPQRIADMDLETLHRRLPLVPTLASVVERFGGRLHLMVEIKALSPAGASRSREILQSYFGHLVAGRDYHLLSLDPALLSRLGFSPPQACIPIARAATGNIRQAVRSNAWGGMAGHYALVGRRHIAAMHGCGCQVGTGFVNSRGCLHREVARGVDWLFSDRPLALQRMLPRGGL